ncbi:hypothetical protein A0H81_12043 [Grifola frondosa]|uniref:Uncharacterized protein n=1 Tax=Grifola frondosa TaxID=5627 RepID=A0A1C7LU42_GRIFR|nr:hypothetical protein A0H81_12043 [Grifola frondosa]
MSSSRILRKPMDESPGPEFPRSATPAVKYSALGAHVSDEGWISFTSGDTVHVGQTRPETELQGEDDIMQDAIEEQLVEELTFGGAATIVSGCEGYVAVSQGVKEGVKEGIAAFVENQESFGGYEADEESSIQPGLRRENQRPRKQLSKGVRPGGIHHNLFNDILREKNVPPPSVLPSIVEAFEKGLGPGPNVAGPQIDWSRPFGSAWNKELIFLLVTEFLEEIRSGSHIPLVYDTETMSVKDMMKVCSNKLQRTRNTHIQLETGGEAEVLQMRQDVNTAARRTVRRHGTFTRRTRIIEQNRNRDPELWQAIHRIHNLLQPGGTSSDETDIEGRPREKRVRRVALRWLNQDVSSMWKAVETTTFPLALVSPQERK